MTAHFRHPDTLDVRRRPNRHLGFGLSHARPFLRGRTVALGFPDIHFQPQDAFGRLLAGRRGSDAEAVLGCFPTSEDHKTDMVELDADGSVRRIVIKRRGSWLVYTWSIAVWGPRFTERLHRFVAAGREGEGEPFVGDVLSSAIADGGRILGIPLPEGRQPRPRNPGGSGAAVAGRRRRGARPGERRMSGRRRWRSAAAGLGLVIFGCGRRAEPAPVLWFGIDAAGYEMTRHLMDRGQLPHLAELRRRGAFGRLQSLEPMLSPALWTTMATGKLPAEHGIEGFLALGSQVGSEKEVLHTTHMVRVRRLWDIAGAAGRTVGVVNYWVTWPPTSVNGFMVSNLWPTSENMRRELAERNRVLPEGVALSEAYYSSTYPRALLEELEPMIVEDDEISDQELARLKLTREGYDFIWDLPEMKSRTAAGLHLYATRRPDLFVTYYWFLDHVAHQYYATDLEPVERAFQELDAVLGRYLELAGDGALVMVVSDHGFKAGVGPQGPVSAHEPSGIVFLAGPNVRRGVSIEGATLLDVAPTLLYAMGLPVAEDMEGRVLEQAFDPGHLRQAPIRSVPTYETGPLPEPVGPRQHPLEEEVKERLRSLGYLE